MHYTLNEIGLLGIAAFALIDDKLYKAILVSVLIAAGFYWYYSISKTGLHILATTFYLAACIVMVIVYLYILFSHVVFKKTEIISQPVFWLCLSTIIFFGCFLPYKGLENYLLKNSPKVAYDLFININLALNIIRYSLVAVSFYLCGKQAQKLKTRANTLS